MAKKKWLGIGAAVAALGAGTAYVVLKVKQSPEAASELAGTVAKKTKEGSEKLTSTVGSAMGKQKTDLPEASVEDAVDGDDDVESDETASDGAADDSVKTN